MKCMWRQHTRKPRKNDTSPGEGHKVTLHLEIKNMFHNKRYGNLAVDSAAKFFS